MADAGAVLCRTAGIRRRCIVLVKKGTNQRCTILVVPSGKAIGITAPEEREGEHQYDQEADKTKEIFRKKASHVRNQDMQISAEIKAEKFQLQVQAADKRKIGRLFSESAFRVAGAGHAHDRKIELIPADLLCIPVLEELR